MITNFQVENKVSKPRVFQKTFLVINVKFEMILEMFFLKINNKNMLFDKSALTWKFYTINKVLSTTK